MAPLVLLCIWTIVVSGMTTDQLISTNVALWTSNMEATSLSALTSEGLTTGQVGGNRAGRNRPTNRATAKSKKKKDQKQMREILIDIDCPRWKPTLNTLADSDNMSISVEFCYWKSVPIPTTFVCLVSETKNCLLLEQPTCSHTFKNLTAGNYTIHIKPICRNCFEAIYLRRECFSTNFTNKVTLGRYSKVPPTSNDTSSTIQPVDSGDKRTQPVDSGDKRTQPVDSGDKRTIIICVIVITVGLAVSLAVTLLVKKFICRKSRGVKESVRDIELGPSVEKSPKPAKHDLSNDKIPAKEIQKNIIQSDSTRTETKPLLSGDNNVENTSEHDKDSSGTLHSYFKTDTGILWKTHLSPPQSDYEIPYHLLRKLN